MNPVRPLGQVPGSPSPEPDDDFARVELQVALLLRRAAQTQKAPWLDRSGYLILQDLNERGPLHVNVLAEHLGLDASTVTRQVGHLESSGRARRTRDPLDGRSIVVEPTPKGLTDLATHRAARRALYADILQDWSAEDRALLAELLERLNIDSDAPRRR